MMTMRSLRGVLLPVVLGCPLFAISIPRAQIQFANVQFVVPDPSPGWSFPVNVAAGAGGTFFFADVDQAGNSANLWQVSLTGSATQMMNVPGPIAALGADGQGNAYCLSGASGGGYKVFEVSPAPAGGFSQTTLITLPTGIYPAMTVDGSGNIFLFQSNPTGANLVYEASPANSYSLSQVASLPAGSAPVAAAVDGSEDLYVSTLDNQLMMAAPATTQPLSYNAFTRLYLDPGPAAIQSLAVDGNGDVYFVDPNLTELMELPKGGSTTPAAVAIAPEQPLEVAANGPGDLCLTGFLPGASAGSVQLTVTQGADFLPAAVATSNPQTMTLNFNCTLPGILTSAPILMSQGDQAPANPDFQIVPGGSLATAFQYVPLGPATVLVEFTPTVPGPRNGAVVLMDSGGLPLATAHLTGIGQAPQVVWQNGQAPSAFPYAGALAPTGVAVDGQGNAYVVDPARMNASDPTQPDPLWQVTPAGTNVSLNTGTYLPTGGVALDGAGNLYFTDSTAGVIQDVPGTGGYSPLPISGTAGAAFVAVDGFGDVFWAAPQSDGTDWQVSESIAFGGGFLPPVQVFSDLDTTITALAVDGAGNLYVADLGTGGPGTGQVQQISPTGTATPVATGLAASTGLAVDASGTVYFSISSSVATASPAASGFANPVPLVNPVTVGTGLASAGALALDASGNLYIADPEAAAVWELNLSTPPPLAFGSIFVLPNFTSTQIATLANIGNQPLSFSTTVANNPAFAATGPGQFSLSSQSSLPSTVPAGTTTALWFNGAATATGAITATATFTDNALNASPDATQVLPFSATGITPPPLTLTPNAQLVFNSGDTVNVLLVPGTPGGSGEVGTPCTFTLVGGALPSGVSLGATTAFDAATLTGTLSAADAGQSFNFSILLTVPSGNYATFDFTLTVNPASTAITLSLPAGPITYTGSPIAAIATPAQNVTVTYTDSSNNVSSTPPTNAGTYTVNAYQTSNPSVTANPITLTINPAQVSVLWSNVSQTYTGSPLTVTATASTAASPAPAIAQPSYSGQGYGPSATGPTQVGTYTVTTSISNPNFAPVASTLSQTMTITALPVTITLNTPSVTQTYGSPVIENTTTAPVAGLQCNVTFTPSDGSTATFPDAGTYAVVATLAPTPANANYVAAPAVGSLTITKATVKVTLSDPTAAYTGNPVIPTYSTTPGPVAGMGFTYKPLLGSASSNPPISAGFYVVTATVVDPNYQGTGSGYVLIVPAPKPTLTLSGLGKVPYGHVNVQATTTPAGVPVLVTYNGSTTVPAGPGTYFVFAITDTLNYLPATASGTLTILKP